MRSLYFHEMRLNRRVLLSLAGAVGLFIFVMALLSPSIQDTLSQALKIVPPILRPLVGERLQVQGLSGVLGIVYTHPVWLTLVGAWAVGYGARAIAGDIERGTMGLTLAYPITRSQLVAAKALTLATGILALVLVTLLATAAGLAFQNSPLSTGLAGYFWTGVGMTLLFGCIGAVSLACSALAGVRGTGGTEAGKALGWSLGFVVGSFSIDALGQFWKTAEPYRAWSIFKQYDPKLLLGSTPPDLVAWLYMGGLIVVSLAVAWVVFNRRDLSL
ncbi:ABC-2 family transporter protein [compost metagenome]